MGKIQRNVYVTEKRIVQDIHYVVGTNEIPIEITIKDYDLPVGATAKAYIEDPKGTIEYTTAIVSGNTVTVQIKNTTFLRTGRCIMQIEIANGNKRLVTFGLPVIAEINRSGDVPESEDKPPQGGITVDSQLSETSTNPLQNKVVAKAIKDTDAKIPNKAAVTQNKITFYNKTGTAADKELFSVELPENQGSGTGGTTKYSELQGKPSINGITLEGDKTSAQLKIGNPTDEQVKQAVTEYLEENPVDVSNPSAWVYLSESLAYGSEKRLKKKDGTDLRSSSDKGVYIVELFSEGTEGRFSRYQVDYAGISIKMTKINESEEDGTPILWQQGKFYEPYLRMKGNLTGKAYVHITEIVKPK